MAKTIQQFLQETTVPDHLQYKVDNWDHHSEVDQSTTKKMDAALGGRSFVTFPLHTEHYDADADVVDHLDKHGYSIKDYIKGIATIKKHVGDPSKGIPMREKHVEEKIGSVLQKTNAPEHILSAFANDPSRQSTKNPNQQHVVISTTPLAIGGMSTGTHWRNQSCMNMEGGSNSHYLRHDSEHGTHIAFLVNGDDHTAFQHGEPSNPVARIALKPYHADTDDGERDTIFRPETNTYGSGNSHFTHAVSKWANENYPALEDHEYEKNSRVYDDSGNNVYKAIGKEAVTKSLDQGINVVDYAGNSLDHHVIDHAIDYAKTKYSDNPELLANAVHNMANVGNLSTHHVAKLYAMTGKNASAKRSLAVYHGDKLSTNSINDYRNHYNDIPKKMLMSPKLPDEIVDNLHPNEYSYVRKSKLKEHHYDKVVDNYIGEGSGSFYTLRDMAGGLSSKHIDRMIDYMHTSSSPSKNSDIAQFAMKHKDFSKGQHEALLDALNGKISYQNSSIKEQIIRQSKYSTLADVQKANTHNGLSALASNMKIDESEHAKVAKIFVDGIKASKEEFKHPAGFAPGLVPETLSKHFKNQDYIDMSAKGHRLSFESAAHSSRYLDSMEDHIRVHDANLTNHLNKQMDANDEYDQDEDDVASELTDKLHKSLEAYATNIDYHIDNHVETKTNGGESIIGNDDEHDHIVKRLKRLGDLDNYMTPENSNRFDDTDHYDNWFAEHDERLNDLEKKTKHYQDYGDDDYDY